MNEVFNREFLRALPKNDLHVHLDGSIRIPTIIELAHELDIKLPTYTEEGFRELIFKDSYESLADYLKGFQYTVAILQSEFALERCAYELAQDNIEEGVYYIEVRFAPQLHIHKNMTAIMVLKAINRGLERAANEHKKKIQEEGTNEPYFRYGIICTAMRMFKYGFSEYYKNILDAHFYAEPSHVYKMASLELARAAIFARDEHGLPIVGFDLAGEEEGYPADDHIEAFQYCQKNFLKKTVHAGEAYGPESIYQAVTSLGADRIGHATYLLDTNAISGNSIQDKEKYVKMLGEFISDRRITIEICLTSNLQTNPTIKDISSHPFRKMVERRLSTAICTDNRTVSNTTVTAELELALKGIGLTKKMLKSIIIYGFKRSFFPGTYVEKRKYVRYIIDYYEEIEQKFFGEKSHVN